MTPISRRGVLATIAAGIAGRVAASPQETPQYVVEQGDRCLPITSLSTDQTAEAFYDYRTPNTSPSGDAYGSYGTTDLQRSETSLCFLYDGPDGVSLVLLHDELNDGTNGGAITFRLVMENPDRGAWVVGDDDYDGPTNYDSFTRTDGGWRVDWTWDGGRSDGGVYRPLGDDFAVTIDPAFNEDATLYGDHYEGEVTDWQVLSGDRSDPDRVSLALDRPLTIRSGSCGERTTTPTTTTTEADEDPSEPISPDVEIVPGKVNPRSHGRLPVVVHSSEAFDATDLVRGSIEFGPEGADPARPAKRIRTDEDGDGDTDLKLLFWMDATGIDWGTERVRLTGETESGREVESWAKVEVVPNGNDDERDDNDESEAEEDETDEREEYEEDEADDADDDDDGEENDEDDGREEDGDDHPGRGNGNGRGKGREEGNGKGRGEGNGKGRGNGRGGGNGKGRGKDD